jgi:hypothetical protein
MKANKLFSLLTAVTLALGSTAFAGATTYQVTGPIMEVNDNMIVVMKGKERFEIDRDSGTKVNGDLKVGEKVTIMYTMTAKNVEVKAEKGAKKEEPKKKVIPLLQFRVSLVYVGEMPVIPRLAQRTEGPLTCKFGFRNWTPRRSGVDAQRNAVAVEHSRGPSARSASLGMTSLSSATSPQHPAQNSSDDLTAHLATRCAHRALRHCRRH